MAESTAKASHARRLETEFLAGVRNKLEMAKGRYLRGQMWEFARYDDEHALRSLLQAHGRLDRDLIDALPANRRIALHGFERYLLFWRKRTGVAVASTVSPLAHYVRASDEEPPPIALGDLSAHVEHLVSDRRVPHVLGICSPTGFTEEARGARFGGGGLTVILIEPDGAGGWNVHCADESVDERILRLFDPEGTDQKISRVAELLAEESAELLTSSLSASQVAKKYDVDEAFVHKAFERLAATDPELRLSQSEGEWLLFRGAPESLQERKSMSMPERIRRLFARAGDEVEKINILTERRAALSLRRDRIYSDIAKLEHKEAGLMEQGRTASSATPRHRIAAQVAQCRKDIRRQNAIANMLNQQIDVINTDIHNLTLIRQGSMAKLPTTEELTQNAVQAEEMLETLQGDSELVGQLETGINESLTSEEELAILREFDGEDESLDTETDARQAHRPEEAGESFERPQRERGAESENPAPPRKNPSEPEAT